MLRRVGGAEVGYFADPMGGAPGISTMWLGHGSIWEVRPAPVCEATLPRSCLSHRSSHSHMSRRTDRRVHQCHPQALGDATRAAFVQVSSEAALCAPAFDPASAARRLERTVEDRADDRTDNKADSDLPSEEIQSEHKNN